MEWFEKTQEISGLTYTYYEGVDNSWRVRLYPSRESNGYQRIYFYDQELVGPHFTHYTAYKKIEDAKRCAERWLAVLQENSAKDQQEYDQLRKG